MANIAKKKKLNIEKIIRNCLIVLTAISLIIVILNFSYLIYQNRNIERINNFLITYINPLIWIDNILLYFCAITYIILGIKSKKEVTLKITFGVFSILSTMIVLTLIINQVATMFGMFN